MLSFNNDPKIKARWVAKGHAHKAADMIMAGTYGQGSRKSFKGCTMGCYARRGVLDKHSDVASKVDGSIRLNYCRDVIFEGLSRISKQLGIDFHLQWIESIPVGVETAVFDRIADKLILMAADWKADKYGSPYNRFLLLTSALYRRRIAGDEPSENEWNNVRRAALDARAALAALDARDALDALAARAARVALDARAARDALAALDARAALDALTARAARDALDAWDARDVLVAWDVWDAFYILLRDEYMKLMSEIS
jgi:hypothetical protein